MEDQGRLLNGLGEDAPVIVGRQTAEGRYEDGDVRRDVREQFRGTLVFARQNRGWMLTGVHLSPIAGLPGGRS